MINVKFGEGRISEKSRYRGPADFKDNQGGIRDEEREVTDRIDIVQELWKSTKNRDSLGTLSSL